MLPRCRAAARLAFCLTLSACASREAAPATRSLPPRPRWPLFGASAQWTLVRAAFPSRGHGLGRPRVEIRVDPPEAAAEYRALVAGALLPAGTRIAALHRSREGAPGSVYAMEKTSSGDWTFLATEPDGTLARGSVALCARCHDEGVADHLFGVPAPEP